MATTNLRLAASLLTAVATIGVVVTLPQWVAERNPTMAGMPAAYLIWPVAFAVVCFALDLFFRLRGDTVVQRFARLPEEFRSDMAVWLGRIRTLCMRLAWFSLLTGGLLALASGHTKLAGIVFYYNLIGGGGLFFAFILGFAKFDSVDLWDVRYALCATLLLGTLTALAGILVMPELPPYVLMSGAGATLVVMAMVSFMGVRFPVVAPMLAFPRRRLEALGLIALLLHQTWSSRYGFLDVPLLPALVASAAINYAAEVVHKGVDVAEALPGLNRVILRAASVLLLAASCSLLAWALLSALPAVSALLLGQWPDHPAGLATLAVFSRLHDAKHLIALFVFALLCAWRYAVPSASSPGSSYAHLVRAGIYVLSGCLAWLATEKLSTLGYGYPILGSAVACGLFSVALAMLVRFLLPMLGGAASSVAGWFSASVTRAFFVGATLALYGLLIRPVVYNTLALAPVYEWLIILAFAAAAIYRMGRTMRTELAPSNTQTPSWVNWSRHVANTGQRQDPRLVSLLMPMRHFIDTGEWRYVWRYLLALMLRNQASLESVSAVFEPMRSYHMEVAKQSALRRPGDKAVLRRREEVLVETLAEADAALSEPGVPTAPLDEETLREAAKSFVDDGACPERVAVLLVDAYWRSGAEIDAASSLWFPLLTMDFRDDPPSLGTFRTLIDRVTGRFGKRKRQWNYARRAAMIDGAVCHLFGAGNHEVLPVALNQGTRAPVSSRFREGGYRVPTGWAVEVIPLPGAKSYVRPGELLSGSVTARDVFREPILPGDYGPRQRTEVGS